MKSAASWVAMALLSGTSDAFWRMPCKARTGLGRLDPIVDPGHAASHSHAIHGGSNFNTITTYDMLRDSECTSCQFKDDKSAYWTPSLHFLHTDGKVEVVPQVGGMLAYYMLSGDDIKAFPEGLEMIAGDPRQRNFTGPFPDPPIAQWTEEEKTQFALGQRALGFNCLNYARQPEPSRYRHTMPDKAFLDQNCVDGLRAEILFPSCWNGKDVNSKNHKSHVAYPDMIDGGTCPPGFPVRLPTLFYETIWDTYHFKGASGRYAWSNGDPTGCGYHADFMGGWNSGVLQKAIDTCTNLSGRVEDCPVFAEQLQTEAEQKQCYLKDLPKFVDDDDCAGPIDGLCGNVRVQDGPEYASAPQKDKTPSPPPGTQPNIPATPPAPAPKTEPSPPSRAPPAPPVPAAQPYKAAPPPGPGVKPVAPPAPAVQAAAPPAPAVKAAAAPPAPAVPAAQPNEAAPPPAPAPDVKPKVCHSTYTSGGVKYVVEVEEVVEYHTVNADGPAGAPQPVASPPAPAKAGAPADSHKQHRRHMGVHARRNIGDRP